MLNYFIIIILYTFLKLYIIFITTMLNGNYIIIIINIIILGSKSVALLALIVLFQHDVLYVNVPRAPPRGGYRRYTNSHYYHQ